MNFTLHKIALSRFILTQYICFSIGSCRWHQTGDCRWNGPRQPQFDGACDRKIDSGHSGYCQCSDGTIGMKKGCEAGEYQTCEAACTGIC